MPERLLVPPIRTVLANNADGTPVAGNGAGDAPISTEKQWYFYWRDTGIQINTNTDQILVNTIKLAKIVTHGTHANRPDPSTMPDGAIYIEDDRKVLYQNWDGTWWYIAGTMYGTISPDQRPTDLGTHDAGFEFRGTDVARQFLWSQTAWVEVTAVQYGTHAARPAPASIVEGALYVESDRGGVIYQRETPAGTPLWQYLAGTMWGTLVPDQRPTDLGVHDAGFDFRTTVAPPREFIWNQTAWVEITPSAAGDVQIAYSTGGLVLTATPTAIPGASIVLNRAGRYLITGNFTIAMVGAGDIGQGLRGDLMANGVLQPPFTLVTAGYSITYTAMSQQWIYTAATAGQTVLLRAYKDAAGTGTSQVINPQTSIAATWINA